MSTSFIFKVRFVCHGVHSVICISQRGQNATMLVGGNSGLLLHLVPYAGDMTVTPLKGHGIV